MRRGLATLPVSLGNSLAYFTSNSSHGIRSASLTQRLSGFMWSPIGWLKSRNECYNLSIGLYIVLAPLYLKSVRKLQEKRFVFVKILAIIIPENRAKVSKIKCFQFAQQTLSIPYRKPFLFSLSTGPLWDIPKKCPHPPSPSIPKPLHLQYLYYSCLPAPRKTPFNFEIHTFSTQLPLLNWGNPPFLRQIKFVNYILHYYLHYLELDFAE